MTMGMMTSAAEDTVKRSSENRRQFQEMSTELAIIRIQYIGDSDNSGGKQHQHRGCERKRNIFRFPRNDSERNKQLKWKLNCRFQTNTTLFQRTMQKNIIMEMSWMKRYADCIIFVSLYRVSSTFVNSHF